MLSKNQVLKTKVKLHVRALPCILSCSCLGSSWAPCRWFMLLGHVGVAFFERRLSLVILFIIFFCVCFVNIFQDINSYTSHPNHPYSVICGGLYCSNTTVPSMCHWMRPFDMTPCGDKKVHPYLFIPTYFY
jgi:hypothetical protein